MYIPTDNQIQQWRDRWKKYPGLAKQVWEKLQSMSQFRWDREKAKVYWDILNLLPDTSFLKVTIQGLFVGIKKIKSQN